MRLSADFKIIPHLYTKHAPETHKVEDVPVVSFPFFIDEISPEAKYLHWAFTDPDAMPVVGFEWLHWMVANVPIDALMYDFDDSRALQIPEDFSRSLPSLIPEAVQGATSPGGGLVRNTNPAITLRYNGPQPPDKDHEYQLQVWATEEPLEGLSEGFWLNEMLRSLRAVNGKVESTVLPLMGEV